MKGNRTQFRTKKCVVTYLCNRRRNLDSIQERTIFKSFITYFGHSVLRVAKLEMIVYDHICWLCPTLTTDDCEIVGAITYPTIDDAIAKAETLK